MRGVCPGLLLAWLAAAPRAEPLEVLGQVIAPGQTYRLALPVVESVGGESSTPVLIASGAAGGPVVCLTGGVHGDELNGVEVVRRSLAKAEPAELRGTLIGVPIVNLAAFRRGSRYLPDRRDLNRFFPGNARGSSASRLAHALFQLLGHCDALVDVHSGSFHRSNLPQVRGDLRNPKVLRLAKAFGSELAVHNEGRPGTLRRAATDAGIPAIAYEAGEPMRFQEDAIELGVAGVELLLANLSLRPAAAGGGRAEPAIYLRTRWVRADDGGILSAQAHLGDVVQRNQVLGTVFDPISNQRSKIRAPVPGRVIGVAIDQLVMPGYAAFHLATHGPDEKPDAGRAAPAAALPSVDEGAGPALEERPD